MGALNIVKKNNLFLIGPIRAGKTSTGRNLSKLLSLMFYDTDHEVQRHMGVTLAWILKLEREEGLYRREHRVLKSLVRKKNILLATGGGIVVSPENRNLLKENGLIIYLRISLDMQQKRTRFSKENRPLLEVPDLPKKIIALHQRREPLYSALADLTYDSEATTSRHLALKIFQDLKNQGLCEQIIFAA